MLNLSQNWVTEGAIDFEYKKYILLAYLRDNKKFIKDKKLYPPLANLIDQHRQLSHLKNNLKQVASGFPKTLKEVDSENLQLLFENIVDQNGLMVEVEQIIEYAIPQLENVITEGTGLYDEVEQQLSVFPVGVVPLYLDEGYLFVSDFVKSMIHLYRYQCTLFEQATAQYRGIHTWYLQSHRLSVTNTYESIKYNLIEKKKEAPATFVIEIKKPYPYRETIFPIVKRTLVRHMAQIA